MRILLLYGTTEGHTLKIATFISEHLVRLSHETELVDANRPQGSLDPSRFDAVVIAARVHAGRYPRSIARFVRRHRAWLGTAPSAFVSVSMAAAEHRPGDAERASSYVASFIQRTGWHPDSTHHAAGARLYARHNALSRWILGVIDRHRYDPERDHEFTDWEALARFVDAWLDATSRRRGRRERAHEA